MPPSHLSDARHRIARADELEAEIEALKVRRAAVEAEAERAWDFDILDAALQASDDLSDQIGQLRRELDKLQDTAAMLQKRRDRAWFRELG